MALGFMIRSDMINSYRVWLMSPTQFVAEFQKAIEGEPSELSEFVRPWNCRPPQSQWAVIRSRIFARDDYTCQYCGARGCRLECDHIVPVAKGGSHDDNNLTTACRTCNQSKRDKTLEEWRGHGAHPNN